jgi:hypothetical protein
MKLWEVAHSRAGDKGDISDISVIAYDERGYELIARILTAERVKAHLGDVIHGAVERFEVPQLRALKFVCQNSLAGGVTRTLNLDAHGKSLSSCLLELRLPKAR